jgi:hypothetical protein
MVLSAVQHWSLVLSVGDRGIATVVGQDVEILLTGVSLPLTTLSQSLSAIRDAVSFVRDAVPLFRAVTA